MEPIVPTDQASIYDALAGLTQSQSQAIVRPANPPPGIAGYVFDILGDEEVSLASDITDHFIEDNTAIQDQIALKPETITLRGLVGELVTPKAATPNPQPQNNPLPTNPGMVPELTPGAEQTQTDADNAAAANTAGITSAKSLYQYYQQKSGRQPDQTMQSSIYGYFYQLWKGRQLFTVETPFGFFTNMAILSLQAIQEEDSRYKSNFVVVFKKIRIAQSITVNVGQLAGRLALEQSPTSQNGNAGQSPVTATQKQSLLLQMISPSP
ncbi:MAG TPA: hypothetical protein VJU82_03530 [Acidobacteriaceae bacterium]|nr:hypothetical protein [Acidobacteriaceae bacterium]